MLVFGSCLVTALLSKEPRPYFIRYPSDGSGISAVGDIETEEEVLVQTCNGESKQFGDGDSDFESKDTDVEGDIDGDVEGEENCDSPVEQSDLSVNC